MSNTIEVRKYRIYPYPDQECVLLEHLETCRRLWNRLLAERKDAWEKDHRSLGWCEQKRHLTDWKRSNEYLRRVYSHVAQDVVGRLEKAFQAFFRHHARYPRFRKYGCYSSFTYPDAYNGCVKLGVSEKARKIYLSKVGYVPVLVHRDPPTGINKRCTVEREGGQWYAVLEYEVSEPEAAVGSIENPVGIDLGLSALVTMSDGSEFDPPKALKHRLKQLAHLQRSVSRKKRGSQNRRDAIARLARLHRKIARIRADTNHKLSRHIADAHGFVAMEDLNIRGMVRNHCLAQAIHDAGWNQLCRFVEYKVERRGGVFVQVPPERTSMECSECGHIQPMPLEVRTYRCPVCGVTIGRDENAARNILKRGWLQVGRDTAELKPVESGVRPARSIVLVQPLCEAGTTLRWSG